MNSQILTGSVLDIEHTMHFALVNDVRPMIERLPLEKAAEAIDLIMAGTPRFRIVPDATVDR